MAKPSLDGPIPRPSAPAISLYPAGARRKRRPAGRVRDDHTVRGAILEPSGIVRAKDNAVLRDRTVLILIDVEAVIRGAHDPADKLMIE